MSLYVETLQILDDKIIKKLRDSDMELVELTSYYIDRYLEDMRALKVIDATIQT